MRSRVPEQIISYGSNKKGACYSLLLFVVILSSGLLKLQHLGHPSLHSPDECCHALVAKNLLKHPFKPTLIDIPYLPTFAFDWGANHVWLHKPILGLWQIAGSYWLFGVNTWALRFPSVILSTLAVWLTYLIGKELLSRQAGFIAATIQAFSPFLMRLIHGYQFSDAVDVSLLFWTEFAIYFLVRALRTGKWWDIGLAGFGQGCAFLSKSYLALIVTGLIVTACVAPALGMAKRADTRIRGRHILGLTSVFLLTILPWTLWTAIQFPVEFQHEHLYVWFHLTTDIEDWGDPWDKVILVYGPILYGIFYLPMSIAVLVLIWKLFSEENIGLTLTYAWGFGVLIPHLLAATKTPSATLIGMPAFLLIFGEGVHRCLSWMQKRKRFAFRIGIIMTIVSLLALGVHTIIGAWQVTSRNRNTRTLAETASYAETQLPQNAVLLVELDADKLRNTDDHLRLMFLMSKTAHPLSNPDAWEEKAAQVRKAGGIPYLVSFREWALPIVFTSLTDKRTIYSDEIP
ncbi:phospholipid carrier-dependent glycosyltransferase [Candidatus Poribacteria bacterium]|nr:phospholipid carrier-dependent glycosyltransferase [Candidatus Poribacteria bacterium]MYA55816.1 phospholipid carrier-dependent glycosyltransferase [Candidatus Poribacteria bacterium]